MVNQSDGKSKLIFIPFLGNIVICVIVNKMFKLLITMIIFNNFIHYYKITV
jgi:hypothetical protein